MQRHFCFNFKMKLAAKFMRISFARVRHIYSYSSVTQNGGFGGKRNGVIMECAIAEGQ